MDMECGFVVDIDEADPQRAFRGDLGEATFSFALVSQLRSMAGKDYHEAGCPLYELDDVDRWAAQLAAHPAYRNYDAALSTVYQVRARVARQQGAFGRGLDWQERALMLQPRMSTLADYMEQASEYGQQEAACETLRELADKRLGKPLRTLAWSIRVPDLIETATGFAGTVNKKPPREAGVCDIQTRLSRIRQSFLAWFFTAFGWCVLSLHRY